MRRRHGSRCRRQSSREALALAAVLPLIAMVWVPSYSKIEPQWLGFPFFYWYQLLWVFISAVITAFVYYKTTDAWKSGASQGGAR